MSKTVAKASKMSAHGSETLAKCRALRSGVEGMRAQGEKYLPKEERESDKDYQDKLARAWLFPAFDKTIEDVADRVFSKPAAMSEDVPDALLELEDNITGDGTSFTNFARELFEDGVEAGISFILIDATRVADPDLARRGLSRSQSRTYGVRPYMRMIRAESVLGWKHDENYRLTMIRYREEVAVETEDEFEEKNVTQIRVMTLENNQVYVRLFRKEERGEDWLVYDNFIIPIDEIAVVPFYTKRTGFFTGKPPYETLADLNIAHWQSAADQRNIAHIARVPFLAAYGMEAADFTVAANNIITTTKGPQEAKIEWVTLKDSSNVEVGERDLEKLELRMQWLGLQLILPKTGTTTATGEGLDAAKSMTPLMQMASDLKGALEQALRLMAKFANAGNDGGSVYVNTDYGLALLSTADYDLLMKAVVAGKLSHARFLIELQRRAVLGDDMDVDEEIAAIMEEQRASGELQGQFDDGEDDAGTEDQQDPEAV